MRGLQSIGTGQLRRLIQAATANFGVCQRQTSCKLQAAGIGNLRTFKKRGARAEGGGTDRQSTAPRPNTGAGGAKFARKTKWTPTALM